MGKSKAVSFDESVRKKYPWLEDWGAGKIQAAWELFQKGFKGIAVRPEDAERLADAFLALDEKAKKLLSEDKEITKQILALWAATGMKHLPGGITIVESIALSVVEKLVEDKLSHEEWLKVTEPTRTVKPSKLLELIAKRPELQTWLVENLGVKPEPKVMPPKAAKKQPARKPQAALAR